MKNKNLLLALVILSVALAFSCCSDDQGVTSMHTAWNTPDITVTEKPG